MLAHALTMCRSRLHPDTHPFCVQTQRGRASIHARTHSFVCSRIVSWSCSHRNACKKLGSEPTHLARIREDHRTYMRGQGSPVTRPQSRMCAKYCMQKQGSDMVRKHAHTCVHTNAHMRAKTGAFAHLRTSLCACINKAERPFTYFYYVRRLT
jgi:hypothetical protein